MPLALDGRLGRLQAPDARQLRLGEPEQRLAGSRVNLAGRLSLRFVGPDLGCPLDHPLAVASASGSIPIARISVTASW